VTYCGRGSRLHEKLVTVGNTSTQLNHFTLLKNRAVSGETLTLVALLLHQNGGSLTPLLLPLEFTQTGNTTSHAASLAVEGILVTMGLLEHDVGRQCNVCGRNRYELEISSGLVEWDTISSVSIGDCDGAG
jgi:hypothetical protein